MSNDQLKLENLFLSESEEIFSSLEKKFLDLEKQPKDQEIKKVILRLLHTLKGSSGIVDSNYIPKYVHKFESVLKSIFNKTDIKKELFSFFLNQVDYINSIIKIIIKEKLQIDEEEYKKNIEELNSYEVDTAKEKAEDVNSTFGFFKEESEKAISDKNAESVFYRVTINLQEKRFKNTWFPEDLINDLTKIASFINIVAKPQSVINWETMDPYQCYFEWIILIQSDASFSKIDDVFLFFKDKNKINIEIITKDTVSLLGQILISEGKITKEELDRILRSQKKIGELLLENKEISALDLDKALKKQSVIRGVIHENEEVKISIKKIDMLIDLVGELIIANSNLSNIQKNLEHIQLDQVQYNINKISNQMRDITLTMKMLPIGQLLIKFQRMIRDLSMEFGKDINFIVQGESTEIDKSMFSILQEALLHLIRNAIDHGIEKTEDRVKSGKNPTGNIIIRAYEEGGQVIIEVEDDGKGLNKDLILKKAIEKGFLKTSVNYSDEEILNVIFESGFSTKEEANLISGRGIGMDVVISEIKKVNGIIKTKSTPGQGTIFTIKLPLTLAIIEGFLLRIGINYFIIPLYFVVECFEIKVSSISSDKLFHNLRGEMMTIVSMNTIFENIKYDDNNNKQVIVIKLEKDIIGILVDEILGNTQSVIKPITKIINKNLNLIGSTVLGNGEVALIIDVINLLRRIQQLDKK